MKLSTSDEMTRVEKSLAHLNYDQELIFVVKKGFKKGISIKE